MPKLPILSGVQIIKALEKLGFFAVRQKGSHLILKKESPNLNVGCVVPLHKQVAVGTLRGILRQAKITPQTFLKVVDGK